ncbi:MAG: helix-turn-helix domain-containing protein [Clostridiales bacterium]|nr:helix-turn-helix domain-containing protein [Clostridiales bacterium]
MITLDSIRAKLIEAIKFSGIKQAEIAEKLHVAPATLSQYLSGRAMPALATFANLCKILDLDANDVLCINSNRA